MIRSLSAHPAAHCLMLRQRRRGAFKTTFILTAHQTQTSILLNLVTDIILHSAGSAGGWALISFEVPCQKPTKRSTHSVRTGPKAADNDGKPPLCASMRLVGKRTAHLLYTCCFWLLLVHLTATIRKHSLFWLFLPDFFYPHCLRQQAT